MNRRLTLWIPGSGVPDLVIEQSAESEDFIRRKPKGYPTFGGTTPAGGFIVDRGSVRYFDYDVVTVDTNDTRVILDRLIDLQYVNGPGTATGGINFRDEMPRLNLSTSIAGVGSRQAPTSGDSEIDDPLLVSGVSTSYFESRGMIEVVDDHEEYRGFNGIDIYSRIAFRLVEFT